MKIAVGQLLVEGGEPRRNLERAEGLIEKAKAGGADLIVLPETMDFAWTHPSGLEEAAPVPGPFSDRLCKAAKNHRLFVCGGLTEKTKEGNFNTALLANPQGEIAALYRKINLLEAEIPFYLQGRSLSTVHLPEGRAGINICSDNYSDALCIGNVLARMGAKLILSPGSWTADHFVTEQEDFYKDKWTKPLRLLAEMFHLYVVSATSVGYIVGGPYTGKKMPGGSLIAKPDGSFDKGVLNEFASDLFLKDIALSKEPRFRGTQFGERARSFGMPY